MAKRSEGSRKGKGAPSKKEMRASEFIRNMTEKDADRFLAGMKKAWERHACSHPEG